MSRHSWWPVSRRPGLRTVLAHVGLWTALVALLVLAEGGRRDETPRWTARALYAFGLVALTAPPVYVHFALLERYFLRGRYAAHLALLVAVTIGWAAAYNWVYALWSGRAAGLTYLVLAILVVVLPSSAIRMLGEVGRQRSLIQEMRARHLQAELDLLKAQVHPHFLFNTLNNLYGLARKADPAAADGIAQLSHLLRYMIYESSADRVALEQEAEQIRRLVELEKLRFSDVDAIQVTLAIDPDLSGAHVAPMLLVPLVENAFKHGIRRSAPSFVRVALSADAGSIRCTVENSLHPPRARLADERPGTGLQNLRRRLELQYPGAHALEIGESGGVFRAALRLEAPSPGGRS